MTPKEAFITKHMDEMCGLLIGAFAQQTKALHKMAEESWAADGKFMRQQMQRGRELLGRIWDEMHEPKKEEVKPVNPQTGAKK